MAYPPCCVIGFPTSLSTCTASVAPISSPASTTRTGVNPKTRPRYIRRAKSTHAKKQGRKTIGEGVRGGRETRICCGEPLSPLAPRPRSPADTSSLLHQTAVCVAKWGNGARSSPFMARRLHRHVGPFLAPPPMHFFDWLLLSRARREDGPLLFGQGDRIRKFTLRSLVHKGEKKVARTQCRCVGQPGRLREVTLRWEARKN